MSKNRAPVMEGVRPGRKNLNVKKSIILVLIFIVIFAISKTSGAGEKPKAVRKLEKVASDLSKELESLNAIFQKAAKQKDLNKTLNLLLLQKQTNHALSMIYDSMAFLLLYDNLDHDCKTQAVRIINNRLLYSKDILISTTKEMSSWQTSFSREGQADLFESYRRIVEPMKKAENTLNNITHFMEP